MFTNEYVVQKKQVIKMTRKIAVIFMYIVMILPE